MVNLGFRPNHVVIPQNTGKFQAWPVRPEWTFAAHHPGRDHRTPLPQRWGGGAHVGAVLHRGAGAHLGASPIAQARVPSRHAGRLKDPVSSTPHFFLVVGWFEVFFESQIAEETFYKQVNLAMTVDVKSSKKSRHKFVFKSRQNENGSFAHQELSDLSAEHYQNTVFKSEALGRLFHGPNFLSNQNHRDKSRTVSFHRWYCMWLMIWRTMMPLKNPLKNRCSGRYLCPLLPHLHSHGRVGSDALWQPIASVGHKCQVASPRFSLEFTDFSPTFFPVKLCSFQPQLLPPSHPFLHNLHQLCRGTSAPAQPSAVATAASTRCAPFLGSSPGRRRGCCCPCG